VSPGTLGGGWSFHSGSQRRQNPSFWEFCASSRSLLTAVEVVTLDIDSVKLLGREYFMIRTDPRTDSHITGQVFGGMLEDTDSVRIPGSPQPNLTISCLTGLTSLGCGPLSRESNQAAKLERHSGSIRRKRNPMAKVSFQTTSAFAWKI